MNIKFKQVIIILSALFLQLTLVSQIEIDNSPSPEDIVAILIGNGVSFSNVTFTGDPDQFGSFNENGSGLGLLQGAILGTGDVELAEGPNDNDGATLGGGNFDSSDPDLDILVNGVGTNDVAILEFDFIPMGDVINFNYIFSSEEYNEYVCSGFNDVFGFFLSGPGITGTFSSPTGFPGGSINIALVPGTTTPVAINTVNNGTAGDSGQESNCEDIDPDWQSYNIYYVDNEFGTTIQYDGYTVTLEASASVQCGETYHIKLAIADGGDTILDSGVFLEENSFSSNPPLVVDFQIVQSTPVENGVYEACDGATLEFSRAGGDLDSELIINLSYSGDAQNGIDYDLPNSITFPVGEEIVAIDFNPYLDGISEITENIVVTMSFDNGCLGQGEVDLLEIFIVNVDPLQLNTEDIVLCGNDTAELIPEVEGGVGNYTFEWSTGESTPTITVDGNGTTEFIVTVDDECEETPALTETINLQADETPTIVFPPGSITVTCEEFIEIEVEVSGNYESIEFAEDDGDVFGLSNPANYPTGLGADFIVVTITDACGQEAEVIIPIIINTPDPISVDVGENISASCLDVNLLEANIDGGGEPFFYSWIIEGVEVGDELAYSVQSNETITVNFEVIDGCGNEASDQLTITIPNIPLTITTSDDQLVCPNIDVEISALAEGGEDGFTYIWSELGSGSTQNFTAIESMEYSVIATDVCGHAISDNVFVNVIPFYVGQAYSNPIENTFNFISVTDPICNDNCSYYWNFGDNSTSELPNPVHIYGGLGVYEGFLTVTNQEGCVDSVSFSIFPPVSIYIPNTFTPNNDGINDVFRVYGIGVVDYEIKIFNRWGGIIYQSKDINEVWVGEVTDKYYYAENETYNYIVIMKGYDADRITKSGTLTILR